MFETALVAFTTLFVTIDPPGAAAVFAGLAPAASAAERRAIALRGVLVAAGILMFFAVFGRGLLDLLGISLAALRTSGGILLLLIAIEMVFARPSGGHSATEDETQEAWTRADISVFPLATPLIAGPGAMGAVVLLSAQAGDDPARWSVVAAMIVLNLLITLALLRMSDSIQRLLGRTGVNVLARVMGILLAALAVQFVFDGIAGSGLTG